jgi:hypothetical protein
MKNLKSAIVIVAITIYSSPFISLGKAALTHVEGPVYKTDIGCCDTGTINADIYRIWPIIYKEHTETSFISYEQILCESTSNFYEFSVASVSSVAKNS